MSKRFLWIAFMVGAVFAISACSSSDDSGTPTPPPAPTPSGTGISDGTPVNPVNMTMSALSGFVFDKAGNPLNNVTVTSGTEVTTTDPDGGFVLTQVNSVNGRSIVKFSCSGYYDVVRSVRSVNGDVWEVVMASEYDNDVVASHYRSASESATLTAGGMTVRISENGFKYADTNEATTAYEYAQVKMFYLSPDADDFAAMMPGGDLAAVRADNSEAQLVSYGMTRVDMKASNGRKLQLVDGKPATLSFPVPAKFASNTPAEIPLWSFNEGTGLWEEEGVATYDAASNTYVGTVTHFSWVNLDCAAFRSTVKVVVKDEAGNPVPNVKVDVDGQRNCFTNVKGEAECFVPVRTDFYVTIHSEDYANYSPEVKKNVPGIATAGATETVELILPTLAHISGKVVNMGAGSALATLWIEYNGKSTKKVHNDAEGQFFMNAPANYTGAAVLKMRAADGSVQSYDITLDGQDHAYTLTIDTDNTTGGVITLSPEGKPRQTLIIYPIYYEDLSGASLMNNTLSYEGNACSVIIKNYSESKTTYDNVEVSIYGDNAYPSTQTAKATVTKNQYGNIRFQISGEGEYQDWSAGGQGGLTKATFSGDFTVPLVATGKILTRVASKSAEWPSFTPWIDGKSATVGLQITESAKLGKGIMLFFYDTSLGYSDYIKLKNQAKASLGTPIAEMDGGDNVEEARDICMSYFYKDGKYVMVSFCPWRESDEENVIQEIEMGYGFMDIGHALYENHAARIHVYALEGMNVDYKNFVHTFE